MSESRWANRGRKDVPCPICVKCSEKPVFKIAKTDGGKVTRSSTGEVGELWGVTIVPDKETLDLAKEYLFKVHGEPEDGRLLDKWIRLGGKYDK